MVCSGRDRVSFEEHEDNPWMCENSAREHHLIEDYYRFLPGRDNLIIGTAIPVRIQKYLYIYCFSTRILYVLIIDFITEHL